MDRISKQERSDLMRSVRRSDTSPEMIVRRIAHRMGARYALHSKRLPGTPDLTLASRKLCIFVHGCFWHRHPGCRLATTPSSNVEFWKIKFEKNVERDARKAAELVAMGWRVETVWECETRRPEILTARLSALLFPDLFAHPILPGVP